jgi:hypothetical protein
VGLNVQVFEVLEQLALLQAYEVALRQFAVKVDVAPAEMVEGIAVNVQVGAAVETLTVALTYAPVPPAFTPATP